MARSTAGARTSVTRGVNYSLSFNGSTDYVLSFESALYRRLNQIYSVEFWVKGPTGGGRMFGWNRSSGTALVAMAGGGTGNAKLSLFYRTDGGAVLLNNVNSTTTILDNTWHHVVISDNAGTVNVYIDKVIDATNFNYVLSGTFLSLDRTSIGAIYASSPSSLFTGNIDQVRVYNAALNQTQVNACYANSGIPRTNLIHEFKFDEGSGSVAANTGQAGNPWKIFGATYSTDVPSANEPFTRSAATRIVA